MKNAKTKILFIFLLFLPYIYAEENIQIFEFNEYVIFKELTVNSTGLPCYNCECNLSLYNEDSSFNSSYIMGNENTGFYNHTFINLSVNNNESYYPIQIICFYGNNYGTSEIKGIKIINDTMDYTIYGILALAICIIFAYVGLQLEGSDPIKVGLKWFMILMSMISLSGCMILGNMIAKTQNQSFLETFFLTLFWLVITSVIFVIGFLILHLVTVTQVNKEKAGKDKDD